MSEDIFRDRGRGSENQWARKRDDELTEKLRERSRLEEIAKALAKKLEVDDPELLRRVMDLGVTSDTGPAFLLAPLVQTAWAEGEVTDPERETLLRIAGARGIDATSPAHAQLLAWLRERPADEFFDTALKVIKAGLAVLSIDERQERVRSIAGACQQVAEASGGGLGRLLGLARGVSTEEESLLDTITATLRSRGD